MLGRNTRRYHRKPYERFTEAIGIGSTKAVEEKARLAERLIAAVTEVAQDILSQKYHRAPPTELLASRSDSGSES